MQVFFKRKRKTTARCHGDGEKQWKDKGINGYYLLLLSAPAAPQARRGQRDSRAAATSKVRAKPGKRDGGRPILTSPMPQVGAGCALLGGRRLAASWAVSSAPQPGPAAPRCSRRPGAPPGHAGEAAAPVPAAPPRGGRGPAGPERAAGPPGSQRAGKLGRELPGCGCGSRRLRWGCPCRDVAAQKLPGWTAHFLRAATPLPPARDLRGRDCAWEFPREPERDPERRGGLREGAASAGGRAGAAPRGAGSRGSGEGRVSSRSSAGAGSAGSSRSWCGGGHGEEGGSFASLHLRGAVPVHTKPK